MKRPATAALTFSLGSGALLVAMLVLPLLDIGEFYPPAQITAYLLAIVPAGLIVHGFPDLTGGLPTSRLLVLGLIAAALGVLATLPNRPEALAEYAGPFRLIGLFVADELRVLAAAALGLSLARYVTTPGVAFLIAVLAAISDLFSVLAGPTKLLLREESPALDFLVLIFPTFGHPLGFGLGLSDFIFIALFSYMSLLLDLHYIATIVACCTAAFLAMATGLLIHVPTPALPFISLAFLLANAIGIYTYFKR